MILETILAVKRS